MRLRCEISSWSRKYCKCWTSYATFVMPGLPVWAVSWSLNASLDIVGYIGYVTTRFSAEHSVSINTEFTTAANNEEFDIGLLGAAGQLHTGIITGDQWPIKWRRRRVRQRIHSTYNYKRRWFQVMAGRTNGWYCTQADGTAICIGLQSILHNDSCWVCSDSAGLRRCSNFVSSVWETKE